jgi:hypothetical protein
MARKSNVDSDGPSTADVSVNEDVEMQDQDTKMSGFKKFGVCPPQTSFSLRDAVTIEVEYRVQWSNKANSAVAVLSGHARLYSTFTVPPRAASPMQTD